LAPADTLQDPIPHGDDGDGELECKDRRLGDVTSADRKSGCVGPDTLRRDVHALTRACGRRS
jgi:hypothetical protein